MALNDLIYTTGTISVTSGLKAFTGSGTAWQLYNAVGAQVIVNGLSNVVASLSSDAAGELLTPWDGPTLSNVPYVMWLVRAEAASALASHHKLAQIIASIDQAQPASANLSALAALELVANKLIGTDQNGDAALFDLTARGRALLAALDAKGQRAVLGFGDGPMSGFRNKFINGDFTQWQRGTNFPGIGHCADRWFAGIPGTGSGRVGVISRAPSNPIINEQIGSSSPYQLSWVETDPGANYGYKSLQQSIEGVRTLAGRRATLSFWMAAPVWPAGRNLPVTLRQNFGSGGAPSAFVDTQRTIVGPFSAGWVKYTTVFDLPSIAGKTIGSNNNDYLGLIMFLPNDSPFTIALRRVSLVEGDATAEHDPFAERHEAEELALCQRYYQTSRERLRWTATGAGQQMALYHVLPVRMRSTPTVIATPLTSINESTHVVSPLDDGRYQSSSNAAAAGGVDGSTSVTLNAEL